MLIRYRVSQFCKAFTRLKRALDPSVLRWDRWCIPPLLAPLHPSSCISSAPRDSIELEHTSRHNAQHKKAGQIIQSLYRGNHFPTQTTLNFFAGSRLSTANVSQVVSPTGLVSRHINPVGGRVRFFWTSPSLSCACMILIQTHQTFHKQMKT